VVASADVATLNDPLLELIVNDPEVEEKSEESVWKKSIDQYNVVPFATLDVETLNVPELPSLIDDGIVPKLYDGEKDWSDMLTLLLVATVGPPIDPVLTSAWNVSAPSVFASAEAVTVNDPELLAVVPDTVKLPLNPDEKSLPSTPPVSCQYKVVPEVTP